MSDSYSQGDLDAAKKQAAQALSAQTGTGPDPDAMASAATGAAPNEVDVEQLKQAIFAMQGQIQQLQAEKAAQNAPAVLEAAETLQSAIAQHATGSSPQHAQLRRLADDAVDAAKNAADSGDGSIVTDLSSKIADGLDATHPGPGDHHWFHVAEGWAKVHLPGAARELKATQSNAPALTGQRSGVPVVAGSVTG